MVDPLTCAIVIAASSAGSFFAGSYFSKYVNNGFQMKGEATAKLMTGNIKFSWSLKVVGQPDKRVAITKMEDDARYCQFKSIESYQNSYNPIEYFKKKQSEDKFLECISNRTEISRPKLRFEWLKYDQ